MGYGTKEKYWKALMKPLDKHKERGKANKPKKRKRRRR